MGEMFTLMSRDSNSHVTNLRKALILLAKMDNSSVVEFTPYKFAIFLFQIYIWSKNSYHQLDAKLYGRKKLFTDSDHLGL